MTEFRGVLHPCMFNIMPWLSVCKHSKACWHVWLNLCCCCCCCCCCLFGVCTNDAKTQLLNPSSDLCRAALTNAQSYALLSIQQHNGHNRMLNYSLCRINMFLAAQTGSEEGKHGKWGKISRRRRRWLLRVATSILASTPIESWGHYFHGCPLGTRRLAYCDRMTLTAVAAQSSLFLSFLFFVFLFFLYFSSAAQEFWRKNKKQRKEKPWYLNNLIT